MSDRQSLVGRIMNEFADVPQTLVQRVVRPHAEEASRVSVGVLDDQIHALTEKKRRDGKLRSEEQFLLSNLLELHREIEVALQRHWTETYGPVS